MKKVRVESENRIYEEIGGNVTLGYPGGWCERSLWVLDNTDTLYVQVSPFRFAKLIAGGALELYSRYDDRAVDKTTWQLLVVPDTYKLVHNGEGQLEIISVAQLAATRLRVTA